MKLIGLIPGHRVRQRMKEMPRIRVEGNNNNTDARTTSAITLLTTISATHVE